MSGPIWLLQIWFRLYFPKFLDQSFKSNLVCIEGPTIGKTLTSFPEEHDFSIFVANRSVYYDPNIN